LKRKPKRPSKKLATEQATVPPATAQLDEAFAQAAVPPATAQLEEEPKDRANAGTAIAASNVIASRVIINNTFSLI
jgi:hypothetical protein